MPCAPGAWKLKAQSMDKIAGHLEVGLNDKNEIVINHPKMDVDEKGRGFIVFSAKQARHLAGVLLAQAAEAERLATGSRGG